APRRVPSMAAISSARLCWRDCAISLSAVQNASSMLTLVLCPAITIERLMIGDFTGVSAAFFDPSPLVGEGWKGGLKKATPLPAHFVRRPPPQGGRQQQLARAREL